MERYKKLCGLRVNRKDSLQDLIYHLTVNGYMVQTEIVMKPLPRENDIDYWRIAVCEKPIPG